MALSWGLWLALQGRTSNGYSEVALILVLNVVVLAMSDLVHNLRAQRRLAELRLAELGQAYNILTETNELRDQMVQNISHELRTPLSMVIGYSELLENGTWGELSTEQKEAAHVIWRNGRRLSEIVEKVTVLDQVGVGQMTHHPTSLNALLSTSINTWQETLLDNYTLRLQMPEKTLNLSGDVQYLRLAIDALLDNAIKFSPEGGEITIKLWNEEGKIYLVIKDQGIGVSEQYQAHLFERFYQVDGSTTRQFGKGSTFGFWMPYMHLQASNKIA